MQTLVLSPMYLLWNLQVDWNERKVPAEGSDEWKQMLNLPLVSPGKANKAAAKANRRSAKAGAAPAAATSSAAAQVHSRPNTCRDVV